jgi:hypothetical protein
MIFDSNRLFVGKYLTNRQLDSGFFLIPMPLTLFYTYGAGYLGGFLFDFIDRHFFYFGCQTMAKEVSTVW